MQGATHFLEQYKVIGDEYNYTYTDISLIDSLDETLEETKSYENLQTIAVWYIKPKVKTP